MTELMRSEYFSYKFKKFPDHTKQTISREVIGRAQLDYKALLAAAQRRNKEKMLQELIELHWQDYSKQMRQLYRDNY